MFAHCRESCPQGRNKVAAGLLRPLARWRGKRRPCHPPGRDDGCRPIDGPVGTRPGAQTSRNFVELSGTIADEPFREFSRDEEWLTCFLLDFFDPVAGRFGCCLVEVPQDLASAQAQDFESGSNLTIVGRISGAGSVTPSRLEVRPPTSGH